MMPRWPFADRSAAEDVPLESTRFVVLDTEFTSLDQRTNRLLSVGAIAMSGSKILVGEQFYRVVNPGVTVPSEGVVIHRLRPEDIEQGHDLRDALVELKTFFGDAVLVGHFAEIDRKVLRKEFAAAGMEMPNRMICTARVQRWIVKKQPYKEDQFHKLEISDLASLARIYGVDFKEAHHALDDAYVTARLWQKQLHAIGELGVKTLGDLLRFAKV